MTTDTATIPGLAAEAAGFLVRGKREADGIGRVLLPKDNRPEWIRDLCHSAHAAGDMLPDDWRYEFIGDALDQIEEADTDDQSEAGDRFREWFDGAYIYTHQRAAWLASRADRSGYCDEAVEEFGSTDADTMTRVFLGMMAEAEEVFASVWSSLEAEYDERDEDRDE